MKETRRLDILAVVGGIIALLAIVGSVYCMLREEDFFDEADMAKAREAILQRMPDTDVRADFEVLSASEVLSPKLHADRAKILETALRKFPDSARLHLRLGTLVEGGRSVERLRRVAELDPENALPVYVLASEAASRSAWDDALTLLKEGNGRELFTSYPLVYTNIRTRGPSEDIVATIACSSTPFEVYSPLSRLARAISERAAEVHTVGRTDEALDMLGEVKRMGRAVIHGEPGRMSDLLVGMGINSIAVEHEKQIYDETGSQAGLARVEQEERDMRYLRAGMRAFGERIMPELLRGLAMFYAPTVSVVPIVLEICLTFIVLIIFGSLVFAARRSAASELHFDATARAFRAGRLLRLYALVFLPLGITASVVFYFVYVTEPITWAVVLAAALVPSILLHWRAAVTYKRAYRQAADEAGQETPRLWKGVPMQERREVVRRLAGVHGGAVVFLLVWGLLISGGMKLTVGGFPWQYDVSRPEPLLQREKQYMADLVAGKIKVPEEKIRELERREKRRQEESRQPAGGDNSGASRKGP